MGNRVARRTFLRSAAFGAAGTLLAACQPRVVEQTKVVKETEVVEKLVTATPGPSLADKTGAVTVNWGDDKNTPAWEAAFRQFQATYPNIKLTVNYGGGDDAMIAAGTPPDIIVGGDVHPKKMGMCLDLNEMIAVDTSFDLEEYLPLAIEPLRVDGKLKMLPNTFNISLLYYNKELFDAEGLAYPKSDWSKDDFVTAAEALTKVKDGKPEQWGVEFSHGWWGSWLIFIRQAGGDWMGPDDKQVVLDTPEAIAGMEYWLSLMQPGDTKVSWLPTEDSLGGFQGNKVAMSYGSHTGLWGPYRDAKIDFDVSILPAGLKRQAGGEQAIGAYGIHKSAKTPDAAWEFLKWLTGYDTQYQFWSNLVGPTSRDDVMKTLLAIPKAERKDPKNQEAVYEAFNDHLGMGLSKHAGFIEATQNYVQPIIDQIIEGKLTVEAGMKEATKAAQDYLDLNY